MKKLVTTLFGATCLLSTAAYGQELSVQLISMKQDKIVTETCNTVWAIQNKTGLNITELHLKPFAKEADGSIMYQGLMATKRIKNGESVDLIMKVFDSSCAQIKTFKIGGVGFLQVDGSTVIKQELRGKVTDAIVVSSKVAGVSVVK